MNTTPSPTGEVEATARIGKLLLQVESARSSGNQPRVHGNGFVQLDLTNRRRLHVWGDPRIPRQSVPSTIHDHTFSFRSTVYVGQLVHRVIGLYPGTNGAYEMYYAVTNQGEDTRLVKTPVRYDALITEEHLLRPGDTYTFAARRFHETVAPWLCVTVIDKDGPTLSQGGPNPNVLVPFGLAPDNTFDRYQTQTDLLWQIIDEALSIRTPDPRDAAWQAVVEAAWKSRRKIVAHHTNVETGNYLRCFICQGESPGGKPLIDEIEHDDSCWIKQAALALADTVEKWKVG